MGSQSIGTFIGLLGFRNNGPSEQWTAPLFKAAGLTSITVDELYSLWNKKIKMCFSLRDHWAVFWEQKQM